MEGTGLSIELALRDILAEQNNTSTVYLVPALATLKENIQNICGIKSLSGYIQLPYTTK